MPDIFLSEWSFAKDRANWSPDQWRNILRSGESKVIMFGGKGSRSYFKRPKNSEFKPQHTTRTIKHVGRSVMVWARFSYYGVGRYIESRPSWISTYTWISWIPLCYLSQSMKCRSCGSSNKIMTQNIPPRRQRKGLGTTR